MGSVRERFGLIGIEADKAEKIAGQLVGGFELDSKNELAGSAVLDGAALRELVEMTPNARHLDEAKRIEIASTREIKVDFRFEILTFTRILKSNEVS